MGKRKVGEKRRQATYFEEVACCPSAVTQGAARQKNGLYEESRGVTGTLGKPAAISTQPKRVWDCTTTLRRLLIGAVQFCSLYILYIR